MSIAPGSMAETLRASGPRGAPFGGRTGPVSTEAPVDGEVTIRLAEILRLQPGDRLLVHADAAVGISAGGCHKLATQLNDAFRLDELGFDVPVVVAAPGLRVEVLRPS